MANPVLCKSPCSDWFFLGQEFAVRTVSMETVQPVCFCFGAKPTNSTFATKIAKQKKEKNNNKKQQKQQQKPFECCVSSHGHYQKRLKRLKFFRNFNMDEQDEHFLVQTTGSAFYYRDSP